MPDFPQIGGASVSDIWGYATRTLTAITGTPRSDLLGADSDLATIGYTSTRAGYLDLINTNLDAKVSTRSSFAAADVWAVTTRALTTLAGQPRIDLMGADSSLATIGYTTTRAGYLDLINTNLDAKVSSRSTLVATDVWAAATRTLTTLAGTPRSDLLGEDAAFSAATGTRIANLDRMANAPAFEPITEASVVMTGAEVTLVEKTDGKQAYLEGDVDLTSMVSGDTITIRQYMIIKSAGTYIKYAEQVYSGAQTLPLLHVSTKANKRSIKVTAQQTATPYRTLDCSFHRVSQATAT